MEENHNCFHVLFFITTFFSLKISFKINPSEVEEEEEGASPNGTNEASKGEIVYGDYLQVH